MSAANIARTNTAVPQTTKFVIATSLSAIAKAEIPSQMPMRAFAALKIHARPAPERRSRAKRATPHRRRGRSSRDRQPSSGGSSTRRTARRRRGSSARRPSAGWRSVRDRSRRSSFASGPPDWSDHRRTSGPSFLVARATARSRVRTATRRPDAKAAVVRATTGPHPSGMTQARHRRSAGPPAHRGGPGARRSPSVGRP